MAPFTGAQQPERQSVPTVHLSAQVALAADVPTHAAVSPVMLRQQSESPVQEVPGFAHVLLQNPRGAQAIIPVLRYVEQHPELQSAPFVQGAAQ